MKKFFSKTGVKKVCYAVLTFILSLCIVGAAMSSLVRFTLLNDGFLSDVLNNSNYYIDLCDEITDDLKDIGDASGLNKSFFEGFINEVFVREDVQDYINKFYKGEKLTVDSTHFDESLRSALDKYIRSNGIDNKYSQSSVNYFIKEATKIYVKHIELKYFDMLQKLAMDYSSKMTILMIVSFIVAAGISLLMIFTNEWKHKAVRYIAYATGAAALFTLCIPTAVYLSGALGKITIISRSLNDMYMSCFNTILADMFIISGVLFVLFATLILIHGKIRIKAT